MFLIQHLRQVPPMVRNGVLAIIATFIGVVGLYSIIFPWTGNDDSLPHLDYVWQVSHGDLPRFAEGTMYPFIGKFPLQYVSNHPPLYYAIQAPVMKLFLDSGDWQIAVALGRGVNILLGIACIVALAWAGWVFSSGNRTFTLLLPAVGAFYITFIQVIGNIMNDSLIVLFSTIALTLSYLVLKEGPEKKYLVWLAVVSALGLLSRSTYVVPLFISLAAIVIAYSGLLGKRSHIDFRNSGQGILVAVVILVCAVVPSSWFYLRNYEQSGSFLKTSNGKNAITEQRRYKSLPEVVTSPYLYNAATIAPLGRMNKEQLNLPFTVIAAVVAIVAATTRNEWKKLLGRKHQVVMAGLLILYFGLILATQIDHAWGYGQYSARYLLPALLPVGLVVSYALFSLRKALPYAVVAFILVTSMQAIWQIADRLSTRQPDIYAGMNWVEIAREAIVQNNVPLVLACMLIVLALAGISWLFWLLFSDDKKEGSRNA